MMINVIFIIGLILLVIILIKPLNPLIDEKDPESVIGPGLIFMFVIFLYFIIFGYYC